jgi:cytochrome bd-type quinol oxidase subunit 1
LAIVAGRYYGQAQAEKDSPTATATEYRVEKETDDACLILIFNTKQNCTSQKIMPGRANVPYLFCLLQSCNLQMNKKTKENK